MSDKINSFYFPHDCNAIQDPKMMIILSRCGLPGIAIYWILIEILHQQKDGKITFDSYEKFIDFYYSFEKREADQTNEIKQMLIKSKLLLTDNKFVWSERVLKNKEFRAEISKKRAIAGKIGGAVSRGKQPNANQKQPNACLLTTKNKQLKERKGKEKKYIKKKIYKRKKEISPIFLKKLKEDEKYRWLDVDDQLERWKDWKSSRGRAFKNNQAAFRNWLRKSLDFLYQKQPELKGKKKEKPRKDWHAEHHLEKRGGENQ